jgi:putative hemolysin
MVLILTLTVVLVLALLSSFFSGSETSLFSIDKSQLIIYKTSDDKLEKGIYRFMQRPDHILITILMGNLFANFLLTVISTNLLMEQYGSAGHIIAILVVTPVTILLLEIIPKVLALNYSQTIARYIYLPLKVIHFLLWPARIIIALFTAAFMKIFRIKLRHDHITVSELSHAVAQSEEGGALERREGLFIRNIMRFSYLDGTEVMFPRNKTLFLPHNTSVKEAVSQLLENDLVRAPVYRKDLDNVIGLVDLRDLLPYFHGVKKSKTIKPVINSITFYPSSRSVNELLEDFLHEGIQMAILLDEYGGTDGVLTLNQLLSSIMGKEYSKYEIDTKDDIRYATEHFTVISAKMLLHDFNEAFDTNLTSIHSDSIGGYFLEQFAGMPKRRDSITAGGFLLTVKHMKGNTLETIEVSRKKGVDHDSSH